MMMIGDKLVTGASGISTNMVLLPLPKLPHGSCRLLLRIRVAGRRIVRRRFDIE